jgi:hypothetical protein
VSEDGENRGVQPPEGAREWLSQMQQLSEQIQSSVHRGKRKGRSPSSSLGPQPLSTAGRYARR